MRIFYNSFTLNPKALFGEKSGVEWNWDSIPRGVGGGIWFLNPSLWWGIGMKSNYVQKIQKLKKKKRLSRHWTKLFLDFSPSSSTPISPTSHKPSIHWPINFQDLINQVWGFSFLSYYLSFQVKRHQKRKKWRKLSMLSDFIFPKVRFLWDYLVKHRKWKIEEHKTRSGGWHW